MKKLILILLCLFLCSTINGQIKVTTFQMGDDPNIIGWWKLNDSNATQPDSSVNSHTGAVTGATYSSSGKFKGCYSFDGNDYITMDSFIVPTNVSFSAWVKIPADVTARNWIVGWGDATGYYMTAMIITNSQGAGLNHLSLRNYDAAGNYIEWNGTTTDMTVNVWHYCVVTQATSAVTPPKIYVDSVSQTVVEFQSGGTPGRITKTLAMGRHGAGAFYYYTGLIDNAAIFNKALSAAEVWKKYTKSQRVIIN